MSFQTPSWTVGIEEEYLMVNLADGTIVTHDIEDVISACQEELGDLVKPEFLQSQIEVATPVCQNLQEAFEHLKRLRKTVSEVGAKYGLAPIAASTHPSAQWTEQTHTNAERYRNFAEDMQAVVRRMIISGMHVHVGIDDDDLRIDLMNQVSYFLPHLLALSTSSPFWGGENTGLKCYRLSVFDELPRTGLPETFDSNREYIRHVEAMVNVGLIKDSSMLWWDIRPALKFPTLEMRITDICTTLKDTVALASLFLCLLHYLYRLRRNNQKWRTYRHLLIDENRWRAQRYGIDEGLVDFGKGSMIAFSELLDELLEMLTPDAQELGCEGELMHLKTILNRGTSAHRQVDIFEKALKDGSTKEEALSAVSKWLIHETMNF